MLIPIIMVGGIAHAIHYFPNDMVNYLITVRFAWIGELCELLYQATFGLFSLILTTTIAISYATEQNETPDKIFSYAVTAIACFGTQIAVVEEKHLREILGNQGCFVAMLVGLLASVLYRRFTKIKKISLSRFTSGMDAILSNAISGIIPMILTVGFFALLETGVNLLTGGEDIHTNTTNQKIVSSIIELSKKLGIKVVAEVVETTEQCAQLKFLGCDWYQGYLFGKPMPLEEFIEVVKIGKK